MKSQTEINRKGGRENCTIFILDFTKNLRKRNFCYCDFLGGKKKINYDGSK